ncbi:MAG: S8 family serine peptidase [Bacteroidota bacterium]|nr:S8 family serine peptidase [Bacteroidota bacterium]
MRKEFLLFISLLFTTVLFAQEVSFTLKSGSFNTEEGEFHVLADKQFNYRYMFFKQLPTVEEKDFLEALGISFLEYIPRNIYIICFQKTLDKYVLESYNISAVIPIQSIFKIDPKIQDGKCPSWSLSGQLANIKVLLHKNYDILLAKERLSRNHSIIETNELGRAIFLEIDVNSIEQLAEYSFISFIEPVDPPSLPENKTARTLHRSNVINTSFFGGRKYNGDGINVMMQDDGLVGPHIDRQGRVDQSGCTGCSSSSNNDHGDHVSGTIMAAGNLDPLGRGMADGAFLYVYGSSNNNYYDVPALYQNNDVIITSKSYSNGCNAGYTSLAMDLDEQIYTMPSLVHVFSAGNDGNSDCGYGAGSGWGNVTGGHKQAKNVITVANLTHTSGLASSSSRGPAADGRIKPDIGGKGTSVYSTETDNTYGTKTGTSMSCPGISGVLAQLYHAYKDLNGGQNPNSGLMKCILLNTADDIGNPGPDFKHGWGEVNVFRAVKLLEDGNYFSDAISQGQNNFHNITIPSGVREVKIMIYWRDKEGSTSASIALVNDINIVLEDPQGPAYNPWILDPTPNSSNLDQNATRGVDDLNNMEQITLLDPIAGSYNLRVNGFAIPFGPQEYWVSYEFIDDSITVTYPAGGESIVPGDFEFIRWDAHEGSGLFSIEYTLDGGINWGLISNSANGGNIGNNHYYNWGQTFPVTDNAMIRVSRNGIYDESDFPFTVVEVPQNVTVDWTCPDSIFISWDPVNGATSYEVSMLGQKYMDSIATTTSTNTLIINPDPTIVDSWFSVCAKVNNGKGRRAIAVNATPNNPQCLAPPLAQFSASETNSCTGVITFIDQSSNMPNSWVWDFGDGNTSNIQNPTHNYLSSGSYDVSLIVSNSLGVDTILYPSYISVSPSPAPITINDTTCMSNSSLTLSALGDNLFWYADTLNSTVLNTGNIFVTPLLSNTTTYYVRGEIGPVNFGGAPDNTIGNGTYFTGNQHLVFDSYSICKIVSAVVYADFQNTITFELRDNSGSVIDDTTITVAQGQQRLYFDFDVPVGNDFELGISSGNSSLYRNSTGASYPYNIGNLINITGSSAQSATSYYYFYYDIEVQASPFCNSAYAPVTAHVVPGQSGSSTQFVTICYNDTYQVGSNIYTSSGIYTDTTSNFLGCDSIITTNLTVLSQNLNNNNRIICDGDSIVVGSNIYSLTGVYTDVLTDVNSCDSIIITDLYVANLQSTINQINPIDLEVNVINGASPYSYFWSTGDTSNLITPLSNGLYWVVITDINGCVSDTAYYTVTSIPSSIIEHNNQEVMIFPNPTNSKFTLILTNNHDNTIIRLLDKLGREIFVDNINKLMETYQREFDLSEYSSGIYFLEIISNSGTVSKKVSLE